MLFNDSALLVTETDMHASTSLGWWLRAGHSGGARKSIVEPLVENGRRLELESMQSRWWIEDLHVLDGGQSISESGLIADAMQHAVVCVSVCLSVCLLRLLYCCFAAALLLLCCCFTASLLLLYL